ncbi:MAG: BRO family protein [Methanomicrobiales archaeon]
MNNFEDFVHVQESVEFWFTRDLQDLLGYTQWRDLQNVIEKAKESCKNSNHEISDHFADANKMVPAKIRNLPHLRSYYLQPGVVQSS